MSYSQTNFKDAVFDSTANANIGSALTIQDILNRAVRAVISRVDLRSTKRRSTISLGLFDEVYSYALPTDCKAQGIIDIDPQVNRPEDSDWWLTTEEEFNRRKRSESYMVAIRENSGVRKLLIALDTDDDSLTVSPLDSLTSGGGTWQAFGDAENVAADADNYVMGSGSIRFDLSSAGGTTAGIYNDDLDSFDFSDYVDNNRSVFVWARITNTTNLTNYKLRIGSSATAYYEMTATQTQEATAFQSGWNLLRFDFSGKTTTGTPDAEDCTYCAVYMTKDGAKVSETAYRFDNIIMRGDVIHDLVYQSKYGWQSNAGVWKENSSAATDVLNADTDEFDLFVLKGKELAYKELRQWISADEAAKDYQAKEAEYKLGNPSDVLPLITTYRNT